jgi:large subunit ribosomal protein L18
MQLSKKVSRKRESLRGSVKGTQARPRLSVFRSNQHIYAQVIDDTNYKTLISCSTLDPEIKSTITQGILVMLHELLEKKLLNVALQKILNKLFLIVVHIFIMDV